jgi:hypothetical protein
MEAESRAVVWRDGKTLDEKEKSRDTLSMIESFVFSEGRPVSHNLEMEALRLAQERLSAGAGTQLEVLDARVALTRARTTELQARSARHNAVTMGVPASDAPAVIERLTGLPEILRVESGETLGTRQRLTALSRDGGPVFDVVQGALRAGDWAVTELFVEPGHLDEVFRTITTAAQASGEVTHS